MKKLQFSITKKKGVYKAFDHKKYQWHEFEDSPQLLDKCRQYTKEDFKN